MSKMVGTCISIYISVVGKSFVNVCKSLVRSNVSADHDLIFEPFYKELPDVTPTDSTELHLDRASKEIEKKQRL